MIAPFLLLILFTTLSAFGAQLDCTNEGFATDTLSFPNCPGYGCCAGHGPRGGSVCKVTNLNDSGVGSLRNCLTQTNTTIVFDSAGLITLDADFDGNEDNVFVSADGIRIACQTAPSPGVLIHGNLVLTGNDYIIEHCNFIKDQTSEEPGNTDGGVTVGNVISGNGDHTLVRNVSIRGGHDESLSVFGAKFVTIMRTTMDKPLVKGPIIGAPATTNWTWYQNIVGTSPERAPLIKAGLGEFVQNVTFNSTWIALWENDNAISANVIGNASFLGDASQGHTTTGWLQGESQPPLVGDGDPSVFLDGNFHTPTRDEDTDPESTGLFNDPGVTIAVQGGAFDTPLNTVASWGLDTYSLIREKTGALVPVSNAIRDAIITDIDVSQNFNVSTRAIAPCATIGTCGGPNTFCSTIACAGGIPSMSSVNRGAGHDDDNDGIPDAVETGCFGDTSTVNQTSTIAGPPGSIFQSGDDYTVLEEYLNAIANMDNPETDATIISGCSGGMFDTGVFFVETTGSAANNCVQGTDTEMLSGDSIEEVVETCVCGGAVENATVYVGPGVYAETIDVTCSVRIAQIGGTAGTVDLDLQGATASGDGDAAFTVTGSDVTIEDMRVINARLSTGTNTVGFKVGSSADRILLDGVTVEGAEAQAVLVDEGTAVDPHTDITIANSTFNDTDGTGAIRVVNGVNVTFYNNVVDDSHSTGTEDNGIECLDCVNFLLIKNDIRNHCDGIEIGSDDTANAIGSSNGLLRDNRVRDWNQRQSAASCGSDIRAISIRGESNRGTTTNNIVLDSNRLINGGDAGTGLELYDGVGVAGGIEVMGLSCFDVDGRCLWARGQGTLGDNGVLGTVVWENVAAHSTSTSGTLGVVEILDPNSTGAGVRGHFMQLFRDDAGVLFRSELSSGVTTFDSTDIKGTVPNHSVMRTEEPLFDAAGLHSGASTVLGRGQAVRVTNCGQTTTTVNLDRNIAKFCFGATGCIHTFFGQDQVLGFAAADEIYISGVSGAQRMTAFNPNGNVVTLVSPVRLTEGAQISFVAEPPAVGLPIGAQR